MSTHAGDIFFDVKVNRKPYDQGMRNIDRGAGALAGRIGKKLAAGLSVAAFGKFIKDTTAAGASLNAMNAIVDAALPNMTAQVDQFAKAAGAAFGLSETQAKGFVGKFASMASAMGYAEKQAYQMSTALTGLAGDVASYYHISQDEAFTKLNAIFTGETEALKGLGVVMTQNALDQFALQQGFGKTTQQMSELEKTTLRYQFVMDRLSLTAGDFAKYANTWSGSIATIKLNWSNFMATVGQGIINILLPLLQVIARVSNALTALGSRFLAWTQKITGKSKGLGAIKNAVSNTFGKGTQKDLAGASNSLGGVGNATKGIGSSAKKAKKEVQSLKRELMGFDQITKLTKQDEATGTTGVGGGGGGSLGGLSSGGVDFSDAEADVKSFSERAKDYLSGIKIPEALQKSLDHLKTSFGDLFEVLSKAGKWAMDNILEPLGKWTLNELAPAAVETLASAIDLVVAAAKLLGEIFEPLWNYILKPFFEWLGKDIISRVQMLGQAFEGLAGFLDKVRAGVVVVKEKIGELLEKARNIDFKAALKDEVTEKAKKLKEFWENLKVGIKEFAAEFKDKVKEKWNAFKSWWDGLKDDARTFTATFVNKVKDAWETFVNWWKGREGGNRDFKATFVNGVKKGWEDFVDWWKKREGGNRDFKATFVNNVKKAWDKFHDWWKGLKGGSKSFTVKFGFTDKIKSGWNGLANKINAARKKSKVAAGILPYIPTLAEGGWVKKNTPQLAMIGDNRHQGEVVAPEGKLKEMAKAAVTEAGGAGNAEVIALLNTLIATVRALNLDIQLDGESIKRNTVRRINDHTRATGQPELIF